jgi:hypothetical protein
MSKWDLRNKIVDTLRPRSPAGLSQQAWEDEWLPIWSNHGRSWGAGKGWDTTWDDMHLMINQMLKDTSRDPT